MQAQLAAANDKIFDPDRSENDVVVHFPYIRKKWSFLARQARDEHIGKLNKRYDRFQGAWWTRGRASKSAPTLGTGDRSASSSVRLLCVSIWQPTRQQISFSRGDIHSFSLSAARVVAVCLETARTRAARHGYNIRCLNHRAILPILSESSAAHRCCCCCCCCMELSCVLGIYRPHPPPLLRSTPISSNLDTACPPFSNALADQLGSLRASLSPATI